MATIRRGYCGRYYDDGHSGALDNGSPACPECAAYEEAAEKDSPWHIPKDAVCPKEIKKKEATKRC